MAGIRHDLGGVKDDGRDVQTLSLEAGFDCLPEDAIGVVIGDEGQLGDPMPAAVVD